MQQHRLVPFSTSQLKAYNLSSQNDEQKLVTVTTAHDDSEGLESDKLVAVQTPIQIHEQNFECCHFDSGHG